MEGRNGKIPRKRMNSNRYCIQISIPHLLRINEENNKDRFYRIIQQIK